MNVEQYISWSPGMTLEAIEKQVILKAFQFFNNNKTTTASALGIAIRTLDSKLDKYKIEEEESRVKHERERQRREEFQIRSRGIARDADGRPIGAVAQSAPTSPQQIHNTNAGVRVESAIDLSAKQSLPVHESEKVQKVLHGQAPASGSRKNR